VCNSLRIEERLDKINETIKSVSRTPKQTKFQTDLEEIRQTIDTARQRAETVEQFKMWLPANWKLSS
jgi:uncharacterized protein YdaL